MLVYHLGNTKFAKALNGEGARLHGGRWNRIGTPCIYTSESKALSVLEYAANVRLEWLPANLSITVYELPQKSWKEVASQDLPADWQQVPASESSKSFGTGLLSDKSWIAFKLPSVIISTEYNFILNPLADNFAGVKIVDVQPFSFDKRIKV